MALHAEAHFHMLAVGALTYAIDVNVMYGGTRVQLCWTFKVSAAAHNAMWHRRKCKRALRSLSSVASMSPSRTDVRWLGGVLSCDERKPELPTIHGLMFVSKTTPHKKTDFVLYVCMKSITMDVSLRCDTQAPFPIITTSVYCLIWGFEAPGLSFTGA